MPLPRLLFLTLLTLVAFAANSVLCRLALFEEQMDPALFTLLRLTSGALVLILCMVQLALAAFRRDGKTLAQLLIGVGQFAIVWVGIITYSVVLVAAAGGLTTALMESLLNVTKWSEWQPWTPFEVKDITGVVEGPLALYQVEIRVWFTVLERMHG